MICILKLLVENNGRKFINKKSIRSKNYYNRNRVNETFFVVIVIILFVKSRIPFLLLSKIDLL